MPLSVGQAWRAAAHRLKQVGFGEADRDAQILLMHAAGLDSLGLIAKEHEPLTDSHLVKFNHFIERRLAHVPVARILGYQEFYGLKFGLNADTLIPRPETEMLVDEGIELFKDHDGPLIADLGAGSGAILISLLVNLPKARGTGFDVSGRAVDQAQDNIAAQDGLGLRCGFVQSDWFSAMATDETYDLIVSNPPYIARDAIPELQNDVKDYDPPRALDGGKDGLDAYRIIALGAGEHLQPNGWLLFEIGYDQGRAVMDICAGAHFSNIELLQDLSGHDRVVKAQWCA